MNKGKKIPEWQSQWTQFFNNDFWKDFAPLMPQTTTNATPVQPNVNIYQKENELLIVVSLPGIEKTEDVQLFVHYDTLEINGTIILHFPDFQTLEEGIASGDFSKSIRLPFPVNPERVNAAYQNGLLFITAHRLIPDSSKTKIVVK